MPLGSKDIIVRKLAFELRIQFLVLTFAIIKQKIRIINYWFKCIRDVQNNLQYTFIAFFKKNVYLHPVINVNSYSTKTIVFKIHKSNNMELESLAFMKVF